MRYPSCSALQRRAISVATLLIAAVMVPASSAPAQAPSTEQRYRTPPPELAALVDQPRPPAVSVAPTKDLLLLMEVPGLLTIADLAAPELRIAGIRINPRTSGPSRSGYFTGLTVQRIDDGSERDVVGLPEEPRIGNVRWSPDGARFAFTHTGEDRIELWVAELRDGPVAGNAADTRSASAGGDSGDVHARRVADIGLNDAYGSPFSWAPDGATLVARTVPADRGEPPAAATVPSGPVIQETGGRVAPARTYQDLLQSPHDEALFEHYLTAQVALVSLDGSVTPLGEPALITRAEPSPDGDWLLVDTIHRPFSYLVPLYRFPHRIEVWDGDGNVVFELADVPLAEEVPIAFDAVPTGPRSVHWRADAAATLAWVEARDGGDPATDADVRDAMFMVAAPFDSEPAELASFGLRFSGAQWGDDDLALVHERWFRDRRIRTWVVQPGRAGQGAEPRLLFDRSWEDRYNDPGSPLMDTTGSGTRVLLTGPPFADGGGDQGSPDDGDEGNGGDRGGDGIADVTLYLSGQGASPEGNRPFLDRLDPATGETRRLWRSEAPHYEYPVDLLDLDDRLVLTRRESVDEPPNYFVRELGDGAGRGTADLRQLTDFPHPTPDLVGIQKELIRYQRDDGVQLTATMYLPPGYDAATDGPLPVLMWAYPIEFKDADAAGQVTDSPHRFVRVGYWGALPWLTRGWAVLDDPSMPIIGEGDEQPNDTYVEQLVASARAAVEEVARRGVGDPERVAIGGHSYGAFMTANLLAHSDLYRAGIARSGAYNRSLTPFGFQREERTFWEAPEVYFAMSPFMHADKVNEPILLIHGDADNNSGTFPIQSERYYHALKGHGATARLVMLPHESHGYRARESVLHMLWEQDRWLEAHVLGGDEEGD